MGAGIKKRNENEAKLQSSKNSSKIVAARQVSITITLITLQWFCLFL